MRVGYIRGTTDEVIDRQQAKMKEMQVSKVYSDKQVGAKEQSELKKMIQELKDGDTVIIESISRLSRSTAEFLSIIEKFEQMGINLISINGDLDTTKDVGRQIIKMLANEAAIERKYLKESQFDGIQAAKESGNYAAKKKIIPDEKAFEAIYKLLSDGKINSKTAMKMLGLKPNTFYRRVKEYEEKHEIIRLW